MGSESISYSGREFHATASAVETWLRLLTLNIHHGGPSLRKLQCEWLEASHDLECHMINLDGHEEHFSKLLKATERLLSRLADCETGIPGEFLALLGFTASCSFKGESYELNSVIKAGRAFKALLTNDYSMTVPISSAGEQDVAPQSTTR